MASYIGRDGLEKEEAVLLAQEMQTMVGKTGISIEARYTLWTPGCYEEIKYYGKSLYHITAVFEVDNPHHVTMMHQLIAKYNAAFQETRVTRISTTDHRKAREIGFDIPQYRGVNDYRPGERY
jgi:hypothetical protein